MALLVTQVQGLVHEQVLEEIIRVVRNIEQNW